MALDKKYVYKISRDGSFLGVLPNVTSQFGYSLDINSAGATLVVDIGDTIDTSRNANATIQTEGLDDITDESGTALTTERQPDIVGNSNSNALIRNNNDIEVIEYSPLYPNGRTVFAGYISKWRAKFGSSDGIRLTCLNYGSELDNYLIEAVSTLDQSNSSQNASATAGEPGMSAGWLRYGQTFTVGASVPSISSILVKLAAVNINYPQTATLKLWNSVNDFFSGTPLAVATQVVSSLTAADYTFAFASSVSITPGATYFFSIQAGNDKGMSVYYNDPSSISTGDGYESSYGGGSGGGLWTNYLGSNGHSFDLYFKTYYSSGATSSPFSSQDPAAIVRTIMDSYISRGGLVTYTTPSIINAGTSRSYTFSVNTILEGIKKMASLAPANYYWFVNPGTNVLTFKQVNTTADYTFKNGVDIVDLEIESTIENLKNIVYFTGGPTAGVNLFLKLTDTVSINRGDRVGIERLTDNRVTITDTGSAIAQSYLDENSDEQYLTNVSILDNPFDTSVLLPGVTIGFEGFGTMVDALILEIVRVTKNPDGVDLAVGVLPRRATTLVENLRRQLDEVQTVANPSTPS